MTKFFLYCRNKWNRIKEKKASKAAFEELLNSPQFKQALFDVQARECERYLAQQMQQNIPLTPSPDCDKI